VNVLAKARLKLQIGVILDEIKLYSKSLEILLNFNKSYFE